MRAELIALSVYLVVCCQFTSADLLEDVDKLLEITSSDKVFEALKKQEKKSEERARSSHFGRAFESEIIIKACKTLLALQQLNGISKEGEYSDNCNRKGYEILRAANELIADSVLSLKNVENLVAEYTLNHATLCRGAYKQEYLKKSGTKADGFSVVEEFFDGLMVTLNPKEIITSADDLNEKDFTWQLKVHDLDGLEIADKIYNTMVSLSAKEKNPHLRYLYALVDHKYGRIQVYEKKVLAVYERYFLNPCKEFIETFGPDIFSPASFEVMSVDPAIRYNFAKNQTPDDLAYFLAWRNFRLCGVLIMNKDKTSGEIVKIVRRTIA